jgi:hypothetical protein
MDTFLSIAATRRTGLCDTTICSVSVCRLLKPFRKNDSVGAQYMSILPLTLSCMSPSYFHIAQNNRARLLGFLSFGSESPGSALRRNSTAFPFLTRDERIDLFITNLTLVRGHWSHFTRTDNTYVMRPGFPLTSFRNVRRHSIEPWSLFPSDKSR